MNLKQYFTSADFVEKYKENLRTGRFETAVFGPFELNGFRLIPGLGGLSEALLRVETPIVMKSLREHNYRCEWNHTPLRGEKQLSVNTYLKWKIVYTKQDDNYDLDFEIVTYSLYLHEMEDT